MTTPTPNPSPNPTPIPSPTSYTDRLREIWRTRPHRLTDEGKVAGVCAGIGARYDVDPTLIRVAFAVATIFGGVGFALYLIAWVCFPKKGEVFELRGGVIVGIVVVAIIVSSTIFDSGLTGSGVVALGAMLGGWWLLHQRTPVPPEVIEPAATTPVDMRKPPTATTASPTASNATASNATASNATASNPTGPPAWDPLGAAPFAWDLPEPESAAAKPTRRRGRRRALSAVAVVVAIAVAAFAGALVSFVITGPDRDGLSLGNRSFTPTTAADLAPTYIADIGNLSVDLRSVDLTGDRTVAASTRLGNVDVVVPTDMRVVLTCQTRAGNTDCSIPTGPSTGPVLTLDVRSGAGDITVRRQ